MYGEKQVYGQTLNQSLDNGAKPADPVSYTHLDVYKRQGKGQCVRTIPMDIQQS